MMLDMNELETKSFSEALKVFDRLKDSDNTNFDSIFNRIYEKEKIKADKRTIPYLHKLWLATLVRQEERRSLIAPAIEKIKRYVTPNENGKYVFYFSNSGDIFQYKLGWEERYKSHSYSFQYFTAKNRDDKITMLTTDTTLGDEFHYIVDRLQSTLHRKVFDMLWNRIKKYLSDVYKFDDTSHIEEIIKLEINGITYLVEVCKEYHSRYITFNWRGEDVGKKFIIN